MPIPTTDPVAALLTAVADPAADFTTAGELLPPSDQATAVEALGKWLQDPTRPLSERHRAIAALRQISQKHPAQQKEIIPLLQQSVTQASEPVVRRAALTALAQIDRRGSISLLERLATTDPVPAIKADASHELGTAVFELMVAVSNSNSDDHLTAVDSLHKMGNTSLAHLLTTDKRPEIRLAATRALSELGREESLPTLCTTLTTEEEVNILWVAISGLIAIGTPAASECLSQQLRHSENWQLREHAAEALGRLKHPVAIPNLAYALVRDERELVRQAASKALAQFTDWRTKSNHLLQELQQSLRERSHLNTTLLIAAIRPHPNPDDPPYQLTDQLIGRAADFAHDPRLTALLAALIIASTDGSLNLAGERINQYQKKHNIPETELQTLRIEIGGATALTPLLTQLQEDLKTYFQDPIKGLNEETLTMWQRTILLARIGFALRAIMSFILFGIGIYLTLSSYHHFLGGSLNTETFFGTGLSFVGGLGLMLTSVYTGPLKDIRKAVTDVGTANAAFIGYVHRIQQISHTFSFFYLKEQISPEKLAEMGALIEDAMDDTIRLLHLTEENMAHTRPSIHRRLHHAEKLLGDETPPAP